MLSFQKNEPSVSAPRFSKIPAPCQTASRRNKKTSSSGLFGARSRFLNLLLLFWTAGLLLPVDSLEAKTLKEADPRWSRIFLDALAAKAALSPVIRELPPTMGPREVRLSGRRAIVFPNIRMHPSSTTTQSEMSVITHPLNPDEVLAGANAAHISISALSQGWYHTTDGGATWGGGDTLPTHTNLSLYMSDPAVGINLDGDLFLNAILFGGTSDIVVARSIDQGTTWSQATVPSPTNGEDKNHMAIDVNPSSPFEGYVYTGYTDFDFSPGAFRFSRSTDAGVSFSAPISISGTVGSYFAQGANLAVGPNSELYATWSGYDVFPPITTHLGFNKSTDGGVTWQGAMSIRNVFDIRGQLNKGGNLVRVNSFPSMAVDRSSGSRNGWIYIVYAEKNPTTPDIFLVRSSDGGATWSAPHKVNQDVSGKDQWFSWISVDPATGHLYVVYYDSRNFPANDSAQVYISSSTDGGDTFEDVLVSDMAFLPTPIPGLAGGYMGDYIGISARNGVVWPCWNDNRTGIHQGYTSRIVFLEVGSPPTITVSPDTLDFGEVFLGYPETLSVSVRNLGFPDTLSVSSIVSDDADFSPETANFALPGGSSRKVKIAFNPSVAGPATATLTINSNDTANPTVMVILKGEALVAPDISVSPDSFKIDLFTGDVAVETLTIANTGGSDLNFDISIGEQTALALQARPLRLRPAEKNQPPAYKPLKNWQDFRKTAKENRSVTSDARAATLAPPLPIVITDPAGDGGGVDITILRGAGGSGQLQIQMELSTPIVPSNFGGFLSLDIDQNPATGVPPSFGNPNQDIGTEYEFQFFSLASGIVNLFNVVTGVFVGSYPVVIGTNTITFSTPLADLGNDDGKMDVTGVIGDAFGPTDWFPDAGHGTIGALDFLAVSPGSGTVPPGFSLDVEVTFDATGIPGGHFFADLLVSSNDPDEKVDTVPTHLHVIDAPNIVLSDDTLDFGDAFISYPDTLILTVFNNGTELLEVTGMTIDNPRFSALDAAVFNVPPGDSQNVRVQFLPTQVGPEAGVLSIASTDSTDSIVAVQLLGNGLIPPDISVSPDSLADSLFTGETAVETLTVSNSGESNLNFEISIVESGGALLQQRTYLLPAVSATLDPADIDQREKSLNWFTSLNKKTGALSANLTDLTGKVIGITNSFYTTITADLQARGATVVNVSFPLSFSLLDSLDVLAADDALFNASPSDINAIRSWVQGGKGLFLQGDEALSSNNQILAGTGISESPANFSFAFLTNILPHPTTVGVDTVAAQSYGAFCTVAPPAQTIVFDELTRTHVAVSMLGTGRVIAVGNEVSADGNIELADTRLFSNQVFDWLAALSDFLSVNPAAGTVPAGSSLAIEVTFDAAGLNGGDYSASILISSNDPDEPQDTTPVHLHVTGAPDIELSDDSLDFGTPFVGASVVETLLVSNVGTDSLGVNSLTSDNPDYTVSASSFSLDPGENQAVLVTFTPPDSGVSNGNLTIASNDPDEPSLLVYLQGRGLLPPDIGVSPDSLEADLFTGETAVETLTITNTGYSNLNFEISVEGVNAGVLTARPVKIRGAEPDLRSASQPFHSTLPIWKENGMEEGKYRQLFSRLGGGNHPGSLVAGPVDALSAALIEDFEHPGPWPWAPWITVLSGGSVSAGCSHDGAQGILDPDWHYRTDVTVGSPGQRVSLWVKPGFGRAYMGFGASAAGAWSLVAAPNTGGLIIQRNAGYLFQDLAGVPQSWSSGVWYKLEVTFDTDSTVTGRVYASDGVTLLNSVSAVLSGFVPGGVAFRSFADFCGDTFEKSSALTWLSAAPDSGTVPAGSSLAIEVTFDAAGLNGGDYSASILISSNDPDEPQDTTPVHLHVTGAPDIELSDDSLDFGTPFVGASVVETLLVSNVGTDSLGVNSLTSDNPDYTVSASSFSLDPGENQAVLVTFTPPDSGVSNGNLTIASNDPDEPSLLVYLQGRGLLPPDIGVSPDSLEADLFTGETAVETLTIANSGFSDLTFDIAIETAALQALKGTNGLPAIRWNPIAARSLTGLPPTTASLQISAAPKSISRPLVPADFLIIDHFKDKTFFGGYSSVLASEFDLNTLTVADLKQYEVVYCEPDWFNYSNLTSNMSKISAYVQSGGVVAINVAGNIGDGLGIDPLGTNYANYAGGFGGQTHESETITDPAHSYITGQPFGGALLNPADFNSWYSTDHGHLFNYPGSSHIVLNNTQDASWLEYPLGGGRVIVTTLTYGWGSNGARGNPLANLINYTFYLSQSSWLSANPTSGTVPAGSSMDIEVTLDAAGLNGGDYSANILISSNDPDEPEDNTPVHLHVTGVPNILLSADTLDFGNAFTGFPDTLTLTVSNNGSDVLEVTGINSSNPRFSLLDPTVFNVAPGDSQKVRVQFLPTATGPETGVLIVTCNDSVPPVDSAVVLVGNGIYPPIMAVSPDSFAFILPKGDSAKATLTIANTGLGTLNWQASVGGLASVLSHAYTLPELSRMTARAELDKQQEFLGRPEQSSAERISQSLPSVSALFADLSGIRIGITDPFNSYTVVRSDLLGRGATVVNLTFPVSSAQLDSLDVLAVDDAISGASPSDINTIRNWLQGGKGLLTQGDDAATNYNALFSGTGILETSLGFYSDAILTNILPHPTTVGVDTVYASGYGAYFTVASPAQTIIFDNYSRPHVAVSILGAGRVLAAGNELSYDGSIGVGDTRLFCNRVFDWLAGISGFLTLSPHSGTVAPGDSVKIAVRVKTAQLDSGTLPASILISGDDPGNPQDTVPVRLTVVSCTAVKGDMNRDSILTTTDVVLNLNCVFLNEGVCSLCFADLNCDGRLAPADVILELNAVFLGKPFPCL